MDVREEHVSSKTLFEGRIMKVTLDQARLPNGQLAAREVCYHPEGAAVLALEEDGTTYLVQQYRYPIDEILLELPAGKVDPGEAHSVTAVRELSEETGMEADEWTYLGYTLASPGFTNERLHMYLARGLHHKKQHLDSDEFLNVIKLPFGELVDKVMDGSIRDGKTVSLTLKTKVLLGL